MKLGRDTIFYMTVALAILVSEKLLIFSFPIALMAVFVGLWAFPKNEIHEE